MRKWLLCKISKRIKIAPKKLETRNATGHYIHNVRYFFTILYLFVARNNPATNGMVHMVDRVLVPAVDTITEVLSADLHFKTMMAALEAAELSQLLAETMQRSRARCSQVVVLRPGSQLWGWQRQPCQCSPSSF